ncbi:type II toxin-antitoxin system antitoxin, RelB/DinJ family [bacterium]|nr:type II toxin-antitoxin system antitoxin, RelB/DinJ family [bacterium]
MATIQLRIDSATKKSAKNILDKLGIDMSSAIKIYLKQIVINKGIPFKVITENGMTVGEEQEILKAVEEAEKGINVTKPMDPDEAIEYLKKL